MTPGDSFCSAVYGPSVNILFTYLGNEFNEKDEHNYCTSNTLVAQRSVNIVSKIVFVVRGRVCFEVATGNSVNVCDEQAPKLGFALLQCTAMRKLTLTQQRQTKWGQ